MNCSCINHSNIMLLSRVFHAFQKESVTGFDELQLHQPFKHHASFQGFPCFPKRKCYWVWWIAVAATILTSCFFPGLSMLSNKLHLNHGSFHIMLLVYDPSQVWVVCVRGNKRHRWCVCDRVSGVRKLFLFGYCKLGRQVVSLPSFIAENMNSSICFRCFT